MKERGSFVFLSARLNKHIHWTRRTYPSLPSLSLWHSYSCRPKSELISRSWRAANSPCRERIGSCLKQVGGLAAGEGTGACGRGKQESRLALMENLRPGLGPCLDLLLLVAAEVSPSHTCRELATSPASAFREPWGRRLASAQALAGDSALDKRCY